MHDPDMNSALRIIDANGNRACEGIRTVEDYLRFHRNDPHLSQMCKEIRHEVSETLSRHFPDRVNCRSTESDVGTSLQSPTEYQRRDLEHIACANLRRVAEALRVLEEYSKLCCDEAAKRFETQRYRAYTLEKCIRHIEQSQRNLGNSRLYALVDLRFGIDEEFQKRTETILRAGVDIIQLRDKHATDRELLDAGRLLHRIVGRCRSDIANGPLFIMNDRPDIAHAVAADGVHVGQDEMDVASARAILGPRRLIGVSTHSLEQARQAVLDGADYIGVGPVFESSTKEFDNFVGPKLVRSVQASISLPSFPIGGVNLDTLDEILKTGTKRVAVGEAIWGAEDVASAAFKFSKALQREVDEES